MNTLDQLKSCTDLNSLAHLLGYNPKIFSYILFSSSIHNQYDTFEIQKKNGGIRKIHAPKENLKKLQRSLANILNDCYNVIEKKRLNLTNKNKCIVSHGFRSKLTLDLPISHNINKNLKDKEYNFGIYSNAQNHIKKKYILNIDLKDFFHTITFGRIVGFFNKNENFKLNKKISILIAQIATYRDPNITVGFLPQGSPSSPIISNLLAGILDGRLNKFSNENKCTYTRFADDITFSTNLKDFPTNLASTVDNKYVLSDHLSKIIERSGYQVNTLKTRLNTFEDRQIVTGLTVNKKVNISKNYYRFTRSMVNSYCQNNTYHKSEFHNSKNILTANSLHGILNHIFNIKKNNHNNASKYIEFSKLDSLERLIVKFNFHKSFIHNKKPIIICEGITDPMHFKNAYKHIYKTNEYPYLFTTLKSFKTLVKITGIGNGTGNLKHFLSIYSKVNISKISNNNPCILLVDGDDEGENVIKCAKKIFKDTYSDSTKSLNLLSGFNVYHLKKNLYIIMLPKNYIIENMYDPAFLEEKLGNRTLKLENDDLDYTVHYGKKEFFEHVIKPRSDTIDFSQFQPIFTIISTI